MYRTAGFDAIFDVSRQFMSCIQELVKLREESRSSTQAQELLNAYGGVKIVLHLFAIVLSSKPLFDSGQTMLMITRDKKDTDAEYFEPHNFLVRLRLAALPLLQDLWAAPWLLQAPLSVSRSIVQTVLEVASGEHEESKGETDTITTVLGVPRPPPTTADENRVRQLTDMGFPRSAAERALIRTHNNVSAATELLLAQPYPYPPDPEPEPEPEQDASIEPPEAGSSSVADETTPAESSSPPAEPIETETAETPASSPEAATGKSTDEWRKELNEAREPLRAGLSRQALHLVDEHPSLLFDVHSAFIRPAGEHQQKAVQDLVDDIKAFSPSAYDVQEQPLAHRCRLLALVLCETPSSLSPELRASLMDILLALLLSSPVSIQPEHPATPRWLAAHLLVTEALFTLADQPRSITLPKENEPIVSEALVMGPPLTEARGMVFDFCIRLLGVPDLPNDEVLSALRLFVLLTRDRDTAAQFVKRDGISMLFKRLRSAPVNGSSSYVATILRHIVEDPSTVHHIMRQAIKRCFAQPRTRVMDVAAYVRNCNAMALRDPKVFIQVTQSLCQLGSHFSSSPHISPKPESPSETESEDREKRDDDAEGGEMQVDSVSQDTSRSNDAVDGVVHFLVGELMQVGKTIREPLPDTSVQEPHRSSADLAESQIGSSVATELSSVKDQRQYACFIMQCLTELLFSYDSCKVAFLSFPPKKKSQTSSKDYSGKFRAATLNFLLSDLISYSTLNPHSSGDRERVTVCNWAMSVLVALCVDSSSTHDVKELSPDLIAVRKFVLEALSRAIKDLPPSDRLESRYGRLLALVDLCHRLLTVRFNNTMARKHQDESPTHIAKVMLEKNFVATLTAALSEVDLNYPNVRGLVASILKPLENL